MHIIDVLIGLIFLLGSILVVCWALIPCHCESHLLIVKLTHGSGFPCIRVGSEKGSEFSLIVFSIMFLPLYIHIQSPPILFLFQFPQPHLHPSCLFWEGARKGRRMEENGFFIGLRGSNTSQSSPFSIYYILHISAGFSEVWLILEAYSCKCEKVFCMIFNIIGF